MVKSHSSSKALGRDDDDNDGDDDGDNVDDNDGGFYGDYYDTIVLVIFLSPILVNCGKLFRCSVESTSTE